MQNDSSLIREDRYGEAAISWREPGATLAAPLSCLVRLTLASRETLGRVAEGDLGEFAVVTAAIAFLLQKYLGTPEVVFRTPGLAGDDGAAPGIVPLIIIHLGDESVEQYLSRVAGIVEAGYSGESYAGSAIPQGTPREEEGLGVQRTVASLTDRRIHGPSSVGQNDSLRFVLRLDEGEIDVFYLPALESFLIETFARNLAEILSEFEPFDKAVRDIEALSSEDRNRIEAFSSGDVLPPSTSSVVTMFEAQAARVPEAWALVGELSSLTYGDLNGQANALARYMREFLAIGPDSLVGVMLDRSEFAIVAILGILKAGAAFVAIDTSNPTDRVAYILRDGGLALLIMHSDFLARWLDFSGPVLPIDLELPGLQPVPENPALSISPESLAYVIYTSGSTGQPKGVLIEHGSLLNYVSWACGYYFENESVGNFGLYSSLGFDFTLTNIFCPLVRGKSLRIYGQSQSIDTILAHAFQPGSRVDTMKLTPSHVSLLEYMEVLPSGIRKVIVGGEELTPRHISILRGIDPEIEIYNEYGPTEATVGCIVCRIGADASAVLVGRPIANTRVHILDENCMPVPPGVRGEICIAGASLARGYHGQPDLTAARFISEPFPGETRLYRTGDLGRWLPDGQVQCFGRIDDQVKIRGFRVELGEIEAVLCGHEAVSAAAVVLWKRPDQAPKLVAFVKCRSDLDAPALRDWLAGGLPEYMLPAEIVFVSEFRLNTNGKIDRAALLEHRPAPPSPAIETTPVQAELLNIWRRVFDNSAITLTDRFFDLGGDSLVAVQIVSRVWSAFSVEISIDDLFALQTIEAISGKIPAAAPHPTTASALSAIAPARRDRQLPLSFSQQRLWFLAWIEGPSAAYNVSIALRLEGNLDLGRIEFAISEIIRRHEILRTTFPDIDGTPAQRIAPHSPVRLPVIEVPTEHVAVAQIAEMAAQAFDLAVAPLCRAVLYGLGPRRHILAFVMHHIVSDAWSSSILTREVSALYRSEVLPELPIQYADYAAWQRERLQSPFAQQHLALQRDMLAGAPDLLELPTDRSRPAVQTFRGASVPFRFGAGLARGLRSVARDSGATTFMVLLAGYALLLSRYSGRKDVVIGSPVANRLSPETEALVGFFVNTLALRIDLSGRLTFRELLARVKGIALENYSRQEIPFEQIVDSLGLERDLSRSPVFQVMFAYESASPDALRFPGLKVTPVHLETTTAKFDLTLYIQDSESDIDGALEFNTDLFDRATGARMTAHLQTLLAGIAANPDALIVSLPLLSPEERDRILIGWNETGVDYPNTPIHRLFERQVERTPDTTAAVFEGARLSYLELNQRANQLALHLLDLGIVPDALVGISMERSLEMIVALLAILKAGGVYVPIDPDYPAERVRFMLENSQAAWLLTQPQIAGRLPETNAKVIVVNTEMPDRAFSANPVPPIAPAGLAYMIYTSGSTGRPKGALNTHRALTNRILWMQDAYRLTPQDVVLQKTPFSFDVSVWEFFWPLITGASLVLARPGGQRESDYLVDLIVRARITTLHFVPSMLRAFLEEPDVERCTTLRRVICSGEALAVDLQEKFFQRLPAELHNLYGPTEAAVDVTFWQCKPNDSRRSVPIGRPIANTHIYIMDESMQPVPIGAPGELLIGGTAVGKGYFGDPELTAAKFIPDPFSFDPAARLYRTGDLARFDQMGVIEFLGRIDHQVKIRGMRIELGEIEETLRKHPQVADGLVVPKTETSTTRLIAYVVAAADIPMLRDFLKERLPGYMVPSLFVRLEKFPLLPNGKIDLKALPPPAEKADDDARPRELPATQREKLLAAIWQEVLNVPIVGVSDNFFDLGGDSILSIQVVARASRAGLRITARQLFQHQTIAELAAAPLEQISHPSLVDPLGETPLTPIQHWFLGQNLPEPSRFNQSVLLQVPADTDSAALTEALREIYFHHDALRLRFRRSGADWIQQVAAPGPSSFFQVRRLATIADMPAEAQAAQEEIDITQGRLIVARLFLFDTEPTGRLFLAAHHLVIDGVSWRILLEHIFNAYRGLPPPLKTTSFREWSLCLQELARSPAILAEAPFWLSAIPTASPAPGTEILVADTASVSFALDESETAALLRQAPRVHDARINEILLTALALSFCRATGRNTIVVDLEGHGRRDFGDGIDVSGTIGWFTTIFPAALQVDPTLPPEEVLKSVREQLRRIPNEGFGFPVLRYLSALEAFRSLATPEILFNYHGQIDTVLPSSASWSPAAEYMAPLPSPSAPRSHVFEIVSSVSGGRFQAEWFYSTRLHNRATVEDLAHAFRAQLRGLVRTHLFVQDPASAEDAYDLSPLQQGILFHALYERSSAAYFQQFSFSLEGALDAAALQQACARALRRHAVLRTAFSWRDLGRPVQAVLRDLEVPWDARDWRDRSATRRASEFEEFLFRDRRRGFDLQTAPLLRCTLIRETDRRWLFCWSTHHILMDGWSSAILFREIFEDYISLAGAKPLPERPNPKPYRKYIDWLAGRDQSEAERWWRVELRGLSEPTLLPRNPYNRTEMPNEPRREEFFLLDEALSSKLREQLRASRLTLNVLLRGAWALLLSRYCGAADVVFGVTVSGRPPALEGVDSMVGLFINTLPVRVRIDAKQPVVELLAAIQANQTAMDCYSWTSLAEIQKWSDLPAGVGLFESLLVFENYPVGVPSAFDPAQLDVADVRSLDETNYPITLTVVPGERIHIRITYDPGAFEDGTIRRMLSHLSTLIESFSSNPSCSCGELDLLPAQESLLLIDGFNRTEISFDATQSFVDRLEAVPSARPWNARANRLARRLLRSAALGVNDLVAIVAHRSERMADAILAIWKCSAAFVPIDPACSPDRIRATLEQSRAKLIVTESELLDMGLAPSVPMVLLDEVDESEDSSPLGRMINPHSLACVTFPPDASGALKGVTVEHAGVLNRLLAKIDELQLGPDSVLAQNAAHCFDIPLWPCFAAPLASGRMAILDDAVALDPMRFLAALEERNVNVLEVVPVWLAVLLRTPSIETSCLARLRTLVVTGEAASSALVRRWFETFPHIPLLNSYGVAETAGDIACHRLTGPPETVSVPVGRPIRNMRIYIVDQRLRLCPIGIPGEICVSGVGVVRSHLGPPELSEALFVEDPFRSERGICMYRTGDMGFFLPDGTIVLKGPKDRQIRIGRHRIEPGEVEIALERVHEVAAAVVFAKNERLLICVIPASGHNVSPDVLRRSLAGHLPGYITPQSIIVAENFPLTSAGRIDRAALARTVVVADPDLETRIAPRTLEETTLIAVWEEVLERKGICITDDYFDLGGDSILAVRLMAKIEQTFRRRLPIAVLFRNPTVETLAAALYESADPDRGLVEIRPGGSAPPLFLLPGAGGNVVCFHALARRLASGRPVYGLEVPGLDGSTPPLASVEEIAAHHLKLIWPVVGAGPYLLAGHSFGSAVALELSRQLIAQGASVELLAILDSTAPLVIAGDVYWHAWDETQWLLAVIYEIGVFFGVDLGIARKDLEDLGSDAQLALVADRISSRVEGFADVGVDRLRAYLRVYKANFRTVYQPPDEALALRIVLLCTAESASEDHAPSPEMASLREDPSWGWSRLSLYPVKVFDVPGNHLTMLLDPNVSVVASRLDEGMKRMVREEAGCG